jgi:hypothetical protein
MKYNIGDIIECHRRWSFGIPEEKLLISGNIEIPRCQILYFTMDMCGHVLDLYESEIDKYYKVL